LPGTWRARSPPPNRALARPSPRLAQALGLEVPTLEGSSAGQLMMEAVAVLLLRSGLKANAASS